MNALLALSAALSEWHKYREEAVQNFRNKYLSKCLKSANTSLTSKGICNEFHFTLYYFGQDGNLLKTVPPAGVSPYNATQTLAVDGYRDANASYPPPHTLETNYKYNSLNQVYEQSTPDAGTSQFV